MIRRRFLLVGNLLISTEGAQIARQIQFMLCFRGKYAVFDDEFDPAPLNEQKFVRLCGYKRDCRYANIHFNFNIEYVST